MLRVYRSIMSLLRCGLVFSLVQTTLLVLDTTNARADSPIGDRLLITDAVIVDGTGSPAFPGEVLVADRRIIAVGSPGVLPRSNARQLSIGGLTLAPGFVDLHNHTEFAVADPEASLATQLAQGITTVLLGLDGRSHQPLETMFAKIDSVRPKINVAFLVGHHSIRDVVLGKDSARRAFATEIEQMQELVAAGMQSGAFGISTGLEYQPGMSATTEELVALANTVATNGGIYVTHLRDETANFPNALEEALRIGRESGIPVHISHIKRAIPAAWGKAPETLSRLHAARASGVDVTADAYPYTAWYSGIEILVLSGDYDDPAAVANGLDAVGGAERLTISRARDPSLRGLTMAAAAERAGLTPVELYTQLMKDGGADVIGQTMGQADVDSFVRDPFVSIASDGGTGADLWGSAEDDYMHPRGSGTYPKVLRDYVRERRLLSLEEAVRKMTRLPADRLGLRDRGSIEPGMWADLVAFDPATVRELSTFDEPRLLPTGIEYVWVNGELAFTHNQVTSTRPGVLLRHKSERKQQR